MKSALKFVADAVLTGAAVRIGLYLFENSSEREYKVSTIRKREENITALKYKKFDILVIGGGASGAGVALDAATRGLTCALVEEGDFASQTSSKSTKLIHGGVRYLEKAFTGHDFFGNMSLVSEALRERSIMINAAPHLNSWVPLAVPVASYFDLAYIYSGMLLYYMISVFQNILSYEASMYVPGPSITFNPQSFFLGLKDGYNAGVIYSDGQMNDSRACISILTTASANNYIKGMKAASVVNHCKLLSLNFRNGKVAGGRIRDELTGEEFDVKATVVINCTGPFSDSVRKMADPQAKDRITVAKGSHFVLPEKYTVGKVGLLIPKTEDGRVLFVIPWRGTSLVGTTDEKDELSKTPKMDNNERALMIRELSRYFDVSPEVLNKEMQSSFAGQRPLIKPSDDSSTKDITRSHEIELLPSGLISVLGGKWTTYRAMAEDAVTKAVETFGLPVKYRCRTSDLKWVNAFEVNFESTEDFMDKFMVDADTAHHLLTEYGSFAGIVLGYGRNVRLVAGHPYLESEVLHAINHEFARTPTDVLSRRLRLTYQDYNSAVKALPKVVDIMASALAWDDETKKLQEVRARAELSLHRV